MIVIRQKALAHLATADPVMARLIAEIGRPRRRHPRAPDFESLARAIVFQQLHGQAAATIYQRLLAAAGGELSPAGLLALSQECLRAAGLSRQKSAYLRDLAERTLAGEIGFERLSRLSDEVIIERLTRVKGIGPWSAQMFLIFALRRPDVMPTADYAINLAIRRHYRKRKTPRPKEILRLAERWRPYRSLACLYLWESLDTRLPSLDGTK